MQPMSDAVAVLGSRHGLFIEPTAGKAYLIRSSRFPGVPVRVIAGVRMGKRTVTLPLSDHGEALEFVDHDSTPCTIKLTGIDPDTGIKVELSLATPFLPRDADFSTTPVIGLKLVCSRLREKFRWSPHNNPQQPIELFLALESQSFDSPVVSGKSLCWSTRVEHYPDKEGALPDIVQRDALVVHRGTLRDGRVVGAVDPQTCRGEISCSWCLHSPAILEVRGEPAPFRYARRFADIDALITWAEQNPEALWENARRVDAVFGKHNLSSSTDHLLAFTLHTWLANSWWTEPAGKEWFTVWEGSCYYHSTVDVEYTQAPFYLSVWPELLGLELDEWPGFTVGGEAVIGERGQGTLVFEHDMGQLHACNRTCYDHRMPVEENTNYVLLSWAYWRRTKDDSRARRHAEAIEKALEFVLRCDSTGNGVPDQGVANTIDDATPAVQYGKEQVYLAVKALTAFLVGAELLESVGRNQRVFAFRAQAEKISRVLQDQAWLGDHFATLVDPSAEGVLDAWTGKPLGVERLPGWDAAHIYTANGLVLLDMMGMRAPVDEERLRTDLRIATRRCLTQYGCRHSDYGPSSSAEARGAQETAYANRIGWMSMNMLRDMAAFYRGVDLTNLSSRYWDFQVLTNTQGPNLFFETFHGNNLCFYPRGVVVFGYFEALAGARIDRVEQKLEVVPLNAEVEVPLVFFADWKTGAVPSVAGGKLQGEVVWT